ncbi:MAG: hypothetical protein EBT21_02925, partial [Actinobacteria bacterium]|nr:hypothetical protein [Actinomycetota bacterium]
TSPGLERSLRTPKHFQREIGKTVNIRLTAPVDGTRRVQGVIVAADDVRVTVRSEDAELTETVVEYSSIEKAKTVFQWGPAPKPGSCSRVTAAFPWTRCCRSSSRHSPPRTRSVQARPRKSSSASTRRTWTSRSRPMTSTTTATGSTSAMTRRRRTSSVASPPRRSVR